MTCRMPLINALQVKDKREINIILKSYKHPGGAINFPALFSISSEQRLPELAKNDFRLIHTVVTAGLGMCFETMNLSRPMSPDQVIDLADLILETCAEDNLALEDLLLFLQKLVRGEYGPMYESLDIPKFMEKFELYREDRFQAIKNIRDEQQAQYGSSADKRRMTEMFPDDERKEHIKAAMQHLIDTATPK